MTGVLSAGATVVALTIMNQKMIVGYAGFRCERDDLPGATYVCVS